MASIIIDAPIPPAVAIPAIAPEEIGLSVSFAVILLFSTRQGPGTITQIPRAVNKFEVLDLYP